MQPQNIKDNKTMTSRKLQNSSCERLYKYGAEKLLAKTKIQQIERAGNSKKY